MTKPIVVDDLRLLPAADQDLATRRRHFDEELAEVRQRGIARVIGSTPSPVHNMAVNAFSVPITDAEGHMVMALSLTSSAERLAPDWDGEVPRALLQAAAQISRQLAPATAA